jgi:hypothetical protein
MRPGSRDTGFPEPFNGQRNTTLPHPDANLSPNATISQDDVAVARVLSRTRNSFLSGSRHKHTVSHGFLKPETDAVMYSMVPETALASSQDLSARRSQDTAAVVGSDKATKSSNAGSEGRVSKDGADSLSSSDGGDHHHHHSAHGPDTKQRRGSFLRWLGVHK